MTTFVVSAILLLIFFIARKPRPARDQQGQHLNCSERTQALATNKALTVATYNVQTGKNLQGQRNINRAATVLRDVDIAGIQEVYAASWSNRLGLGICQTAALAQVGNFAWLFCPTRYRWLRENRGNAILSKLPINSWQTIMLPDQSGISFRNMTVVSFTWHGQDCYFINTHLHTGSGKLQQLLRVIEEFNKYSRVILVGDFNCKADTESLIELFKSNDITDAIASSNIADSEQDRIDWIITKGWQINSGQKTERGISDHPFYAVSLELDNQP